jgi:hypothetical protein
LYFGGTHVWAWWLPLSEKKIDYFYTERLFGGKTPRLAAELRVTIELV